MGPRNQARRRIGETMLLDDPKIKKYFGCDSNAGCKHWMGGGCKEAMALRVIEAMEQPIKNGEKFLVINGGTIGLTDAGQDYPSPHWNALRLPDRFQPKAAKECGCFCHQVHPGCCPCVPSPAPSPAPKHRPTCGLCPPDCKIWHFHCYCATPIHCEPTPEAKCEHGAFKNLDGIAPCYKCHSEMRPPSPDKAVEVRIKQLAHDYWNNWLNHKMYPGQATFEGILEDFAELVRQESARGK